MYHWQEVSRSNLRYRGLHGRFRRGPSPQIIKMRAYELEETDDLGKVFLNHFAYRNHMDLVV